MTQALLVDVTYVDGQTERLMATRAPEPVNGDSQVYLVIIARPVTDVRGLWADVLPAHAILRVEQAFRCPVCDRVSYNPHDLAEGYCGACHAFTGPRSTG